MTRTKGWGMMANRTGKLNLKRAESLLQNPSDYGIIVATNKGAGYGF